MNHEPRKGNALDVIYLISLPHSPRLSSIAHSSNHLKGVVRFGQVDADRQTGNDDEFPYSRYRPHSRVLLLKS